MADLATKGAFVMPTPRIVKHEAVFNYGQDILDPPPNTEPPVSAARAWQIATKFGLLARPVHGTYQLLLGDLTGQNSLHRPVWMVVGRDVPVVPLGGGPALPSVVNRPPQPPCYFDNVIQPVDATTGQSLFYSSGGLQVP